MMVMVIIIGFCLVIYFVNRSYKENKKTMETLEKILEIEEKKEEKMEEIKDAIKRRRVILDSPDWYTLSDGDIEELDEIDELLEQESIYR